MDENKALNDYLKKFAKLSKSDAEKLFKELKALDNSKLKDHDLAKIIDYLPADSEDLNKLLAEAILDEKETNDILEIVRKY